MGLTVLNEKKESKMKQLELQTQSPARQTVMERLEARLSALEMVVSKLGPEQLKERIATLEENMYACKGSLTLAEAAKYLGISKSMLYKHTYNGAIPCYRPGGKMLYFERTELDHWVRQRGVATAEQRAIQEEADKIAEEYLRQKENGTGKKK